MARNGSGVYSLPAGSLATTGTGIIASTHNTPIQDLEADANTARPVVAGGTGATSASGARTNLGLGTQSDAISNLGLGNAAGSTIQSSTYDATAGRLLINGAFGLGVAAPEALTASNALDSVARTQWNRVMSANRATVNGPSETGGGVVLTQRYSTTNAVQTWYYITDTRSVYRRTLEASTWSAWTKTFDQSNALGTVSQTSGVPTGALQERVAGVTSTYSRYADGTQICRARLNGGSSTINWTFPAQFASAPAVVATADNSEARFVAVDNVTTSGADIIAYRDDGDPSNTSRNVIAIGGWFLQP